MKPTTTHSPSLPSQAAWTTFTIGKTIAVCSWNIAYTALWLVGYIIYLTGKWSTFPLLWTYKYMTADQTATTRKTDQVAARTIPADHPNSPLLPGTDDDGWQVSRDEDTNSQPAPIVLEYIPLNPKPNKKPDSKSSNQSPLLSENLPIRPRPENSQLEPITIDQDRMVKHRDFLAEVREKIDNAFDDQNTFFSNAWNFASTLLSLGSSSEGDRYLLESINGNQTIDGLIKNQLPRDAKDQPIFVNGEPFCSVYFHQRDGENQELSEDNKKKHSHNDSINMVKKVKELIQGTNEGLIWNDKAVHFFHQGVLGPVLNKYIRPNIHFIQIPEYEGKGGHGLQIYSGTDYNGSFYLRVGGYYYFEISIEDEHGDIKPLSSYCAHVGYDLTSLFKPGNRNPQIPTVFIEENLEKPKK
jgi:hypothetical protein